MGSKYNKILIVVNSEQFEHMLVVLVSILTDIFKVLNINKTKGTVLVFKELRISCNMKTIMVHSRLAKGPCSRESFDR